MGRGCVSLSPTSFPTIHQNCVWGKGPEPVLEPGLGSYLAQYTSQNELPKTSSITKKGNCENTRGQPPLTPAQPSSLRGAGGAQPY